jgi:hypothetical protein
MGGDLEVDVRIGIGTRLDTASDSSFRMLMVDSCPSGYFCKDGYVQDCPIGHYCEGSAVPGDSVACP